MALKNGTPEHFRVRNGDNKMAPDGSKFPFLNTADPRVALCAEKDSFERIEDRELGQRICFSKDRGPSDIDSR